MSVVFTGRLWSNGEWRADPVEYYIAKYNGQRLISINPDTVLALEQEDISNIDSYGFSPTYNVAYVLVQEYLRLKALSETDIDVRICMNPNDNTHHYIKFNGGGNSIIWYVNENVSVSINGCTLYPLPDSSCHPIMWTTANNINEISPLHSEVPSYFGCIEYLGGYNKVIRSDITQVVADASIIAGISNPFEYSLTEYNNSQTRTQRRVGHKVNDAPCYAIIGQNYFGGGYWNSGFRLFGPTADSVRFNVDVYDRGQYTGNSPGSNPAQLEYNGKLYWYSGIGTLAWGQTGYRDFSNPNDLTVLDLVSQSSIIENWLDLIGPLVDLHTVEASEPIYFVLSYRYVPNSDVDPENIPPADTPPVEPEPDNPDPYIDPKDPDDPQDPGDPDKQPTETGGGDPPERSDPDPVTPPDTPPSHAIDSHFVTLYTPSLAQLNSLAQYLWSSGWSVESFKKILANPMDCILGLMIFPALAAPTGSKNIYVGNLDTGITMSYVSNQYVDVNCGSFEIEELYGSYLDYSPYTKIDIYLPYIGMQSLSADDVMGKTVSLLYRIDLLSSACVAFLIVDDTTLYTFTGSCGTSIPVSGTDWSNMLNGIINVAGVVGTAIVTGGASLSIGGGLAAASSMAVSALKPQIRRGGSVASAAGLMSIQTPYLIITRPRMAVAENQNAYQGYPSYITQSLGSCVGYTEVEEVHLEHVPATDEEIREIETLLKGGVLF